MVTARSDGFCVSASRQRAASHSSAVESGPPETASTSAGKVSRPENSDLASVALMTAESAVRTLEFLRHAALHAGCGARIFTRYFGQRGAGRFLLMQRSERLAEAQQGVGRLAAPRP